jgi:hypothetical protein
MRAAKRLYRRWPLLPSHDKLHWKTSTLRKAIALRVEQYERCVASPTARHDWRTQPLTHRVRGFWLSRLGIFFRSTDRSPPSASSGESITNG